MSNNTEFQVGDRVELVEHYMSRAKLGEQGTVIAVSSEDAPVLVGQYIVCVKMDNGAEISVYAFRLKHVEATPVPKEFRFFRRSDAAISDIPYVSFEEALAGWKVFAQDGNEVEIIEIIPHGKYKAVLKIEEA
jgi:hypothetical protein